MTQATEIPQPRVAKKRRTLLQVVLGKPKQTGITVTWPGDVKGRQRWRKVRRTAKVTRAVVAPVGAAGWRYRAALAPWWLLMATALLGRLVTTTEHPFGTAMLLSLAYGILAVAVLTRVEGERRALTAAWGLAASWLTVAVISVAGTSSRPVRGLFVCMFLTLAVPWWNHHRFGGGILKLVQAVGGLSLVWQLRMKKIAPGTAITQERPIVVAGRRIGTEALIEVVDDESDVTTSDLIKATEKITAKMRQPIGQVAVDAPEDGRAHSARLLVFDTQPLRMKATWPGCDLNLATGVSTLGPRMDGTNVPYVWCFPNFGPWHDIFCGTTGSGKSKTIQMLFATSRAANNIAGRTVIADWVVDPQEGQSAPDWRNNVDRFASGVAEGLVLLRQAVALMLDRNARLSRMPWVDDQGRPHEGYEAFPWMDAGMPLLVVTIFEAHMLLAIPEAAELVAKLGKMARKCGIKVRIEVQMPSVDQLGGSMLIRGMVASGNAVVFRTSERLSGQAVLSGLPVDPASIPRLFPGNEPEPERITAGLGYSLGAETSAVMFRAWIDDDPYGSATAGQTWGLDDLENAKAGAWPPAADDVIAAAEQLTVLAAGEASTGETAAQAADTRSLIVEWLAGQDGPQWRNDIVKALARDPEGPKEQPGRKARSGLHPAITAMVKDGSLIEMDDKRLTLKETAQ
jgi:hypothetical protein